MESASTGTSRDPRRHGLALALKGRCGFCAEIAVDPGVLSGRRCSSCGGRAADSDLPDLLLSELGERSKHHAALLLAVVSLAGLVLGFVPFLGFLPMAAGLVAFRMLVVGPALHLMSRARRLVSRWTLRLLTIGAFAAGGAIVTLVMAIPAVNAVGAAVSALVVLGLVWWIGRAYLLWQLRRERHGAPVAFAEVAVLVGVVTAAVVLTLLLVGAVVLAWSFLESLLGDLAA